MYYKDTEFITLETEMKDIRDKIDKDFVTHFPVNFKGQDINLHKKNKPTTKDRLLVYFGGNRVFLWYRH